MTFSELETSQLRASINTLLQRHHLKSAPEHFRMQQCLQRAFRFGIGRLCESRPGGNNSGEKMMLIGKSGDASAVLFGAIRDTFPIDVRSDIGVTNLLEWRIELSMVGAGLHNFAEFLGESVIDD